MSFFSMILKLGQISIIHIMKEEEFFKDLQQGAFRYIIFILRDLLNQSTIAILSGFAFITSATIFFKHIHCKYKIKKLFISFISIDYNGFLYTKSNEFVSSGIRSGIAFTILLVAIVYLKGSKKYILFGLSCLMHLSMIPIICLYFLYYMLSNKRINFSFIPFFINNTIFAFLTAIAG